MTTTGFLYSPDGRCVARIKDGTDVLDATREGRGKIATIQGGNLYDLEGNLLGHLALLDGKQEPAPEGFMALFDKPAPN